MAKTIIALSGWKQSGKDSSADYIIKNYGFHKISLAGALKHNTSVEYGIPPEYFHDNELKESQIKQMPASEEAVELYKDLLYLDTDNNYYWTPRALLIHEGRSKRLVDKDYWVRALFTSIFAADQAGQELFVLSDLRFPSEVEAFKKYYPEYDFIIIRVDRFDSPPNNDDTERSLDNYNFDYVLKNKGDINELAKNLNVIMGCILNEQKCKPKAR